MSIFGLLSNMFYYRTSFTDQVRTETILQSHSHLYNIKSTKMGGNKSLSSEKIAKLQATKQQKSKQFHCKHIFT